MPRSDPPLTDDQRRLAAEWTARALDCASAYRRRNPSLRDEIDSAAMAGVMRAARSHDASHGPMGAFVALRVRGAISRIFQDRGRLKRDARRERPASFAEHAGRDWRGFAAIDDQDEIDAAFARMKPADCDLYELLAAGHSLAESARRTGLTAKQAYYRLAKIREKLDAASLDD